MSIVTSTNSLGVSTQENRTYSDSGVQKNDLGGAGYNGGIALLTDSSDPNSLILMVEATEAMGMGAISLSKNSDDSDVIDVPFNVNAGDNTNFDRYAYYKLVTNVRAMDPNQEWVIFVNIDQMVDGTGNDDKKKRFKFSKTTIRPM